MLTPLIDTNKATKEEASNSARDAGGSEHGLGPTQSAATPGRLRSIGIGTFYRRWLARLVGCVCHKANNHLAKNTSATISTTISSTVSRTPSVTRAQCRLVQRARMSPRYRAENNHLHPRTYAESKVQNSPKIAMMLMARAVSANHMINEPFVSPTTAIARGSEFA